MPTSWFKNMTTWFQIKKDQSRDAPQQKEQQESATPKPERDLASDVLDIMHRRDPKDYGPKRPNKP